MNKDNLEDLEEIEREGTNAISNAVKTIQPSKEIITGVHSAFEANTDNGEPREATDLRTRLMLKYYMVDIDIFNSHDSRFE